MSSDPRLASSQLEGSSQSPGLSFGLGILSVAFQLENYVIPLETIIIILASVSSWNVFPSVLHVSWRKWHSTCCHPSEKALWPECASGPSGRAALCCLRWEGAAEGRAPTVRVPSCLMKAKALLCTPLPSLGLEAQRPVVDHYLQCKSGSSLVSQSCQQALRTSVKMMRSF